MQRTYCYQSDTNIRVEDTTKQILFIKLSKKEKTQKKVTYSIENEIVVCYCVSTQPHICGRSAIGIRSALSRIDNKASRSVVCSSRIQ